MIKGVVQGVGFRPFVFGVAQRLGVRGRVFNGDEGVIIECCSSEEIFEKFVSLIKNDLPVLGRIDTFEIFDGVFECGGDDFFIDETSHQSAPTLMIPPDVAVCPECKKELLEPTNRRYGYPFINCTACGPRYSIIHTLPYDRPSTSMDKFVMCPLCDEEYHDPSNRRYHAQPNACPACGPKLFLKSSSGMIISDGVGVVDSVVERLQKGEIGAIKGVGGFHLVCMATNESVEALRKRKNRPKKPFAVMVENIDEAKEIGEFAKVELEALASVFAPIVVVKKSERCDKLISSMVAPNLPFVGVFLPYSPLHTLLLEKLSSPIVATSANRSGDPVCISCDEVVATLGDVVDFIVDFNRDIVNRCDDSVVRFAKERPVFLRVGRGYAPVSFPLLQSDSVRVGVGAGQKVTLSMNVGGRVVVSPYIGDVASPSSLEAFRLTLQGFLKLYNVSPDVMVCDRHGGYLTTQEARHKNFVEVAHHHAHIVACMAENSLLDQKVLGVAWDGTGLGDDGEVWGGEFLVTTVNGYERVGSFAPLVLVGGESAIKDPRKVGLGVLCKLFGEEVLTMKTPFLDQFSVEQKKLFYHAYVKRINSVTTSSIGRLFDAVATLLMVVDERSYEGESGLSIERMACSLKLEPYEMACVDGVWQWEAMVRSILHEEDKSVACKRFLVTLAQCVIVMAQKYNLPLVLSGGVFQNATLVEMILDRCNEENIVCYTHKQLPPNDGCISVGQVFIARSNDLQR